MSVKIIDNFEGEYAFLSNFFPCTIEYGNKIYPSTEHFYQAMKTIDEKEREIIRSAPTPGEAKKAGRSVTLRDLWDEMKLGVMRHALAVKFKLGTELGDKLLATQDATLVEGNWWGDTFWGVCKGVGDNNLGKLLMERREVLKQDAKTHGVCTD